MRIWLVCHHGHPRAVFSTAEGARDYLADHGVTGCWEVQYLVLDVCAPSQRIFPAPGAVTAGPGAGSATDRRMRKLVGGDRTMQDESFSVNAAPKPASGLHSAVVAALAEWLVSPPLLLDGRSR